MSMSKKNLLVLFLIPFLLDASASRAANLSSANPNQKKKKSRSSRVKPAPRRASRATPRATKIPAITPPATKQGAPLTPPNRSGSAPLLGSPVPATSAVSPSVTPDAPAAKPSGVPFEGIFLADFYGPDIARFNPYRPDPETSDINKDDPVAMSPFMMLGYKFAPGAAVGIGGSATLNFYDNVKGETFIVDEPFLYVRKSKLVKLGTFSLDATARLYGAITDPSRNQNILGAIRLIENLNFDVPESRFSIGLYTYQHGYLISEGTIGEGTDYKLYFAPSVSYKITPKVAAVLSYQNRVKHAIGDASFRTKSASAVVEPAVSVDVLPNLNLLPWLDLDVAGPVRMNTTTLGLEVGWAFL
jgi:hypothetical protein